MNNGAIPNCNKIAVIRYWETAEKVGGVCGDLSPSVREMRAVGFIMMENDNQYSIAQIDDETNYCFCHYLSIPKCSIKSINIFEEPLQKSF